MRHLTFVIFVLTGTLLSAQVNSDVDLLGIAGILIRDGNYQRAQDTLEKVNLEDGRTDRQQFYVLSGLVSLRKADYPKAEDQFKRALESGKVEGALFAYLAQAQFSQGKYAETVESINKVPRIKSFPDLMGLKSQALWELGRKGEAYDVLEKASEDFPSRLNFLQQQIAYLLDLGLTQQAVEAGREYLSRAGVDLSAYLTLGEAFRRGKQPGQAVSVLETARLAFSGNPRVLAALAQTYLDLGLPKTAAGLVEEASLFSPGLVLEAAELYRKTGQWGRALYLNGLVSDIQAKSSQRLSILLEAQRYEEALALLPRIERLGLLEDDRMKYAVAFVYFQTQNFHKTQAYLGKITSPEVFSQAVALRKALETAKAEPTLLF